MPRRRRSPWEVLPLRVPRRIRDTRARARARASRWKHSLTGPLAGPLARTEFTVDLTHYYSIFAIVPVTLH